MNRPLCLIAGWLGLAVPFPAPAQTAPLAAEFPAPESRGGWKSLLPESGEPDDSAKAEIRRQTGADWDKLNAAWLYNASMPGNTGLVVIQGGKIIGEWYRGGDRHREFNIYSSSKAYTSTAFGLILSDFGAGPTPSGKSLSLDTPVCNADWLPESLPLPDPRKAEITVRHLLNMASGLGIDPVPSKKPFEVALGHEPGSAFAQLKGKPGTVFHYSNAGVAHLVLAFKNATGTDLEPFLREKLLDPIGVEEFRWAPLGGDGGIGPYSQGYSGIHTNPRQHARFCQLALHKGEWAGKRIVPASYYDFAWQSSPNNPTYGGQWWVYPRWKKAPKDLVMTSGRNHNDGFVLPSRDLVFVRLGDGNRFPRDFEDQLVAKILVAFDR
ncbi:serine hydrolase domain-containing protein [Tundrisphaera sp. TA3]|uniref:serine hydrolase domain-containing protein n=1 Tax=Tundrisphaera sp. TA3 TaxID=3435775 RepID=UPI003EBE24DE